jgi:hypothetical protein
MRKRWFWDWKIDRYGDGDCIVVGLGLVTLCKLWNRPWAVWLNRD